MGALFNGEWAGHKFDVRPVPSMQAFVRGDGWATFLRDATGTRLIWRCRGKEPIVWTRYAAAAVEARLSKTDACDSEGSTQDVDSDASGDSDSDTDVVSESSKIVALTAPMKVENVLLSACPSGGIDSNQPVKIILQRMMVTSKSRLDWFHFRAVLPCYNGCSTAMCSFILARWSRDVLHDVWTVDGT